MALRRCFLLLTTLLFVSAQAFAGGPWTQMKHKLYVQLGYNIIAENNRLFSTVTDDHILLLSRAVTDQTIGLYAEYGVTDKFTIVADIPYKMTSSSANVLLPNDPYQAKQGNLRSFGNISLTGKYQIYKSAINIATDLTIHFPTAIQDFTTRLSTGYMTYGFEPKINIGYGNNKLYAYSSLSYNYQIDLIDQIKASVEIGYKIYKDLYTIIAVDILQSTQEIQPRNDDFLFLYQDQQEYFASTLKLSKGIYKNMGLNFHMTIITVGANYVQKGPAMGGSVYFKF
ncbi:MAG: hypothetical protein V3V14_07740 [Saprospiraceae bacterium]